MRQFDSTIYFCVMTHPQIGRAISYFKYIVMGSGGWFHSIFVLFPPVFGSGDLFFLFRWYILYITSTLLCKLLWSPGLHTLLSVIINLFFKASWLIWILFWLVECPRDFWWWVVAKVIGSSYWWAVMMVTAWHPTDRQRVEHGAMSCGSSGWRPGEENSFSWAGTSSGQQPYAQWNGERHVAGRIKELWAYSINSNWGL